MEARNGTQDTIVYRDERNVEREVPLAAVVGAPLHLCRPVRKPRSRREQMHLSGYYWFASSGRLLLYESMLEMTALLRLDFDPAVAAVSSQPFRLRYLDGVTSPSGPKRRSHVPDLFVRYRDGDIAVVNVKRRSATAKPEHRRAARAMSEACRAVGWAYREMHEPREPLFSNLSFLAAYRRPSLDPGYHGYAVALVDSCADAPRPVGRLLDGRIGPPSVVKPVLFHLLWRRVLDAHGMEEEPLSGYTFVSLAEATPDVVPRW